MQEFQSRLDVIGNNIANANTVGYKSGRLQSAEAFSQTLQAASASTTGVAGALPIQVGNGVATSSIQTVFTQGAVSSTGVATDLAINGEGFFMVKDPINGASYATRAGDFHLDENNFLVTDKGMRLQGLNDVALTTAGDLKIDTNGAAAGISVASYNIDSGGFVNVRLSNGTNLVRGQLTLQKFTNPSALMKAGDSLYTGLANAGPLATPATPTNSGTGKIQSGALELSNVDMTSEFASLITAQRGFSANAKIVTTSDEILQEVVNLKH